MTTGDAVMSALDALRLHKLRSALTMLGIIIGVAAVIAMMAVGGGAREQVIAQIRSLGSNLLVVTPGNITAGGVRMGSGAASTLTDDDSVAIMNEVGGVQVTAPNMRGTAQLVAGGMNWATGVFGIDNGWFEARDWDVEHGRMFEPEEITRGAQVILIGQTVARNLYGGIDPVGQELRVRNVPFRIIGVMSRKGQTTWGQDQDDVVFVPLNTGRQRVLGRNMANARAVGSIYVKVRDGEDMSIVENDVKSLLRQRHRLQPGQEDDFTVRNLADIAATREASARTLALLLAAVAGVSLAVGGIGIMNIMLVSVTERTREIGLRLAVGARQWDILRQFLFEATGLAAIGGLIGVLIGVGAAYIISNAAGWPLLIEPASIVLAVLFSGLVGVFFGWYPALRASRLDPIEALRHT
ncbi:ABC transporter permease [Pseudorhodoplanes sinuspersici]|uniref:Multidrug ABC transporter substrate-binding protein n=1 Tax=Pseudorhodoplanes sinuspersici TaxID=1235591 RepID=A0A1W6ZPV3_9HYPH|nr:ABC transporter permease [Pseudorhodoplanes sinuspersici]ARP99428.1 multidrug ABC transporter substrate-binding protein [Pseudorhodoplanes sinuspersici]RKE70371.1 putative ABC transport system permease protein [Pseudorhodoplanes sinuspersici]